MEATGGARKGAETGVILTVQIQTISFTDDNCTGSAHFLHGPLRVFRIQINSANRMTDQNDLKTLPDTVKYRVFDAIVGGQPTDKKPVNTALVQQGRQ